MLYFNLFELVKTLYKDKKYAEYRQKSFVLENSLACSITPQNSYNLFTAKHFGYDRE